MATALFILSRCRSRCSSLGALLAELPLEDQLPDYLRALGGAAVLALVLAGIGLVVAAMTPRRGLGVAAVVGVLLVLSGIQATVRAIAEEFGNDTFAGYAGLISPFTLVDGIQPAARRRVGDGHPAGGRRDGHGLLPGRRRGRRLVRRCCPYRKASACYGIRLPASLRYQRRGHRMSTLELEQVSRWYGNVVAVNDVTMHLGPGVTGLLGPNGAGKSTLINMMAGFLAPSAGTVTLDGRRLVRDPEVYRDIGLVPEREEMYDAVTGW